MKYKHASIPVCTILINVLHKIGFSAPTQFLLCSQKNRISRMLPDPNEGPYMVLPIRQIRNIQTMDFDPMTNNIYWVDRRSGSIKHANINGSKVHKLDLRVYLICFTRIRFLHFAVVNKQVNM